ncbi:hypothetical protein SAMD00019534_050980 [Acytostelium subglobosum LB1]|uniref:hypothetical protein n=1 Tax=Acytostelium subglobosum LB1 TaxID=1410327 RepID=UPI000644DBC1|nr:hypothetical protein SAMD00019534_050980 [Acytostelium subglobosum LB1]GAM21923.1 hypothetical protein SAMD00019534_050980 [Acytostelium subglobosum LB1]|eukprot:XP_012755023.1 hypothetical protein SAMD00019534_050980 [Acytostelium subglobosum LB1]
MEAFDDSEPSSPRLAGQSANTPKKAGRRKIKIEFIEDKSRRHITFSKRKAGIMKKAFELSTLTGTQVLLLVASETGHVYTFATSKLQPLISRPDGKNMIQQCLNATESVATSTSTSNSTATTPKSPPPTASPSSASSTPSVPSSSSSSTSSVRINSLNNTINNQSHIMSNHSILLMDMDKDIQFKRPIITRHPTIIINNNIMDIQTKHQCYIININIQQVRTQSPSTMKIIIGPPSKDAKVAIEMRNYYANNHNHVQHQQGSLDQHHPSVVGYGYANNIQQQHQHQQQQQYCQPANIGHVSSGSATPNRGFTPGGGGSATSSPPSSSQFAYPPPHSMIGQYQ